MKSIRIEYAHYKFIDVLPLRKKKNGVSFLESLAGGFYGYYDVRVVNGLDEFIRYVIKHANDKSSNRGKWYVHCNGFCLGVFFNYTVRQSGFIRLNTYYNYRRDFTCFSNR
jgi:hypothetical protein